MKYIGEKRPPWVMLLFSIFSLGLFNIYWVYIVSYEIKAFTLEEKQKPIVEVLGTIITLGIYLIYWSYKYEKKIHEIRKKEGVPCRDWAFLMSVISFFLLFPINMMIIQSQLNELWDSLEEISE